MADVPKRREMPDGRCPETSGDVRIRVVHRSSNNNFLIQNDLSVKNRPSPDASAISHRHRPS